MRTNVTLIKNKLINRLMISGKKRIGEQILLQSFKELHKSLRKSPKELFQLSIIFSTPIFKLHIVSRKKKKKQVPVKIPFFITQEITRTSLAIKFILLATRKKKSNTIYLKLKEEILLNAQYQGEAIELKNDLQNQVLVNKRFFSHFRWR